MLQMSFSTEACYLYPLSVGLSYMSDCIPCKTSRLLVLSVREIEKRTGIQISCCKLRGKGTKPQPINLKGRMIKSMKLRFDY